MCYSDPDPEHPGWRSPFGNGWGVRLLVSVTGDAVGCMAQIPAERREESLEPEQIIDRVADLIARWILKELVDEIFRRFATAVLASQTPSIVPANDEERNHFLVRLRGSTLVMTAFQDTIYTSLVRALTTHLAMQWELDLEDPIAKQLTLSCANDAQYLLKFPPDKLEVELSFASRVGVMGQGDEVDIVIPAGSKYQLPISVLVSEPILLQLTLGK